MKSTRSLDLDNERSEVSELALVEGAEYWADTRSMLGK